MRGHEETKKYKYEGYRTQSFWKNIKLVLTSIFKFDTLVLFGFIVGKVAYVGMIESGFQVFAINYSGYHLQYYDEIILHYR